MPAAQALAHTVAAAEELAPAQRRAILVDFDPVFGLSLDAAPEAGDGELPDGAAHGYSTSERIRQELAALGIEVPTPQPASKRSVAADPVHGRAAQCGAVRAGDHRLTAAVRPRGGSRPFPNVG